MKNNCSACEHWDIENAWGERKDKAACRVKPPTVRQSGAACDTTGQWPSTRGADWCGAYEQRYSREGKG